MTLPRKREPQNKSLRRSGTRPILTASDVARLAVHGSGISLMVANNALEFEINAKRSRDAGLRISSQLLDLAIGRPKPRQP
ncbi:MAG: YfiR family protein [Verrucomicrobiia bacterium]